MKWEEFQAMLKAAGITQTEFSRAVSLTEWTVSMWRKRKNQVPTWVRSWLTMYAALGANVLRAGAAIVTPVSPAIHPAATPPTSDRVESAPSLPSSAPASPAAEHNPTSPPPLFQPPSALTVAPVSEETAAPSSSPEPAAESQAKAIEPASRLEFLEERTIAPLSE